MYYKYLAPETWEGLDGSGNSTTGYKSTWLSANDLNESNLYIFKDETGNFHLAIEAADIKQSDMDDPDVNGLNIEVKIYKFASGKVSTYIDLKCNISGYLPEFTEVVIEIAEAVFENDQPPIIAVKQVINRWVSFWKSQKRQMLSEDEQVGLICELIILNKLCEISPGNALKTWTGPLGEKHDFNFTNWNLEVKGTRKSDVTHIINGIDQLKPAYNKHLAFISFLLSTSQSDKSVNLPSLIDFITKNHLNKQPNLIIRFNELLANIGYSPIHNHDYEKLNVEIIESALFEVNEDFPKLTSSMLMEPVSSRVSKVRYSISLEGVQGSDLEDIKWGDYFY